MKNSIPHLAHRALKPPLPSARITGALCQIRHIHKTILAMGAAWAFAILAIFLCLASPAMAMSVRPIVLDLTTSGSKARGHITVVNDSARPLPIEILVQRLELDENGNRTTTPADDDFAIFPVQKLIAPGATQTFHLQWSGDTQIPVSQTYIFSVNQVQVTMPQGKSGVQVVFNFDTIVNVAPPGGNADITLLETSVGKDNKGKTHPTLRVKNPGNSYAKLSDATIKLSSGAWSKTLSPSSLRQTIGMGLVQPGKTRRFLLPVDMPRGVNQITASIEYKPQK
jgi:fimbrial chaperone protein